MHLSLRIPRQGARRVARVLVPFAAGTVNRCAWGTTGAILLRSCTSRLAFNKLYGRAARMHAPVGLDGRRRQCRPRCYQRTLKLCDARAQQCRTFASVRLFRVPLAVERPRRQRLRRRRACVAWPVRLFSEL